MKLTSAFLSNRFPTWPKSQNKEPCCCLQCWKSPQKRVYRSVASSLAASWTLSLPLKGGRLVDLLLCYFDFSVTILRCYQDVYVYSFFLQQLDSAECFLLTYDLNGLEYWINPMLCSDCSVLHGVNPKQKKIQSVNMLWPQLKMGKICLMILSQYDTVL